VSLTVTDASGLSATVTRTVTVAPPNVAPTAAFTASCTDLVCSFIDTSVDADGRVASRSWSFGDGATSAASPAIHQFAAAGTYAVKLTAVDDDGASASTTKSVDVRRLLHAGVVSGGTTKWYSPTNPAIHYWSANIVVAVHGANEQPVAGATVTAGWTGGVTKTASCVTAANGQCTFKSGTLSMLRNWVTLTVTGVSAPLSVYAPSGNHGFTGNTAGTAITYTKP
jgi:PKD repeat protein